MKTGNESINYFNSLMLYFVYKEDKQMQKLMRLAIQNTDSEIVNTIEQFLDISKSELQKWYLKKTGEFSKKGMGFVGYYDENYPLLLREIPDFPLILFYRGDISILPKRCVSIVGSRKVTHDGKKICDSVVRHLREAKINVVSGLAFGVDSLVHKASINYGIPAISVLPSSVDSPVPKTNLCIAEAIIKSGGLLLSERPSGYKIVQSSYIERNRIISGLSDRTLIIEAALKSGSMTTAKFAIEQNRDLYALPGSISNPVAEGCNYLIHKGANCLYRPEVFFDYELEGIEQPDKNKDNLPEDIIIRFIAKSGRVDIDEIIGKFKIPESELLAKLLEYELSGAIIRNGSYIETYELGLPANKKNGCI